MRVTLAQIQISCSPWSYKIQDATWRTSEWGKLKEEEREREGVGALGEGLEGPAGRGASGRPNMERNSIHTACSTHSTARHTGTHIDTISEAHTHQHIYSLTHLKRKRGTQSRGGHLDSVHSDMRIHSDSDSYACTRIFSIWMQTNWKIRLCGCPVQLTFGQYVLILGQNTKM